MTSPQPSFVQFGSGSNFEDVHVWVEARLKTQPSNFDDLTVFEATATSQGPVKLCLPRPGVARHRGSVLDLIMSGSTLISVLATIQSTGFTEYNISLNAKSVCSEEPSLPTNKSNFSLSRLMEEARRNNLFTDITLVADGKEFKAHEVILASHSQFFKTYFSGFG